MYDTETQLYYLQSRYYNPEMGRFLSADVFTSTGQGLLGNNMFAYCRNGPVFRVDTVGYTDEECGPNEDGNPLNDLGNPNGKGSGGGANTTGSGGATHLTGGHGIASATGSSGGANASGGGPCFLVGTMILAADGTIPIEEICEGDMVWSWDEETGDVALKEVVETYVNETDELVHIFAGNEEIITTPSHPFYSPVKGWTDAVRLRAGDILVLVNGEYVVVEKVQHEILEAPITVYNFQVADYHTYYVTDDGVLVHNSCTGGISTGRTTPNNLVEKLAMESAQSNPAAGKVIIPKLKDTRFPSDFSKFSQTFPTSRGVIEIHYVGNLVNNTFTDFKFK